MVIMDGVGISDKKEGNAFLNANTPNLDYLMNNALYTTINAHGTYVGLPTDNDMGNSEVGHNAIGCGQIYSQGAKLCNEVIDSKELYNGQTWKDLVDYCKKNTLHFIGLLSDGNVHSHINHLLSMLEQSKKEGIKNVRVHILLDGRDVDATSALNYVDILENKMNELNDESFNSMIASGGGRMNITMDRYEANWSMVEKGWHTHVLGDARYFNSAKEAIETYRNENPGVIDQDLDSFVIVKDGKPVGTINDGDSVIFFNFRGDRAIEISKAFDEETFDKFNRVKYPKVYYAGMLEYDSELKIPKHYLTEPPKIKYTLTEELNKYGIREYAVSETQKYGHVTYFWNGNRIDKFNENLETYDKVDSDIISFDKAPKMKSYEITDKMIEAIKSNKYDFLRLNYPNGDMVGHTGNYEAAKCAVEHMDKCLGKIYNKVVKELDGTLMVIADHGNCDVMWDENHKPVTSHTTNPVHCILTLDGISLKDGVLSDVAPTMLQVIGLDKPIEMTGESLIK